ncbi:MAG: HlyD family efflux transporter periplasmic adaptor subunit [Ruminococcaceae bacterium]|nr:HlyD family efflux transporter periplasmic adaptor subunit [Oscillospiraceae bacterium]
MSKENTNAEKNTEAATSAEPVSKAAALKKHKGKKKKKIIKTVIIISVILIVLLFAAFRVGIFGKNMRAQETTHSTYTVSKRTITEIIESTGTIAPKDEYYVTPLVNGEILEDYFEEGDNVVEDQPLYLIDSESGDSKIQQLANNVEIAENNLNRVYDSMDDIYIKSTISGTIEKIHIEVGDDVRATQAVADVIDKKTMLVDIPFFEVDVSSGIINIGDKATVMLGEDRYIDGYVKSIGASSYPNTYGTSVRNITVAVTNNGSISNSTAAYSATINECVSNGGGVFEYNDYGSIISYGAGEIIDIAFNEGDYINKGDYFATFSDTSLKYSIEDGENNVENALINLDNARDELDNYKIKAPKTGKIVTKTYKTGDTVYSGMTGTSLAVIYDMSALKFTMNIDELDIDKLEIGQDVIVTCDSREGKEYNGKITNMNIIGTTVNGTTTYPVEVTIDNVEIPEERITDKDGTIHKKYKTGMTSTVTTHNLVSSVQNEEGTFYNYSGNITVKQTITGELYIDDTFLRQYGSSYVIRDNFYTFSDDFSTLTLEQQNTKEMLRISMNVDAKIIIEKHVDVLAIPLTAVSRGDIVKVIKNPTDVTPAKGGDKQIGTAPLNVQFEEVRVKTGVSDDDYIEILEGINENDIVLINPSDDGIDDIFNMMMGQGGPPAGNSSGGGMQGPPAGGM